MIAFGRVCHELFTEKDNITWCPVRLFGIPFSFVATVIYFGLAVYTVVGVRAAFDFAGFGEGLASIWGVTSLAIAGKAWVEK